MSTTTNMNLVIPNVGSTVGPTYASLVNAAFEAVDAHDHTTGKGVLVPSAGLNINADLDFNESGLTDVKMVALYNQVAAPSNVRSIYSSAGDLYYKNSAGTEVQITTGGSVNATGTGIISYSTPGAYPYSVSSGDAQKVIGVTTTVARVLNLPAASTAMAFWVKDITGTAATNNITVNANGSDTIDGAASLVINEDSAARMIISTGGTAWYIL
jgi:hypothetical protein